MKQILDLAIINAKTITENRAIIEQAMADLPGKYPKANDAETEGGYLENKETSKMLQKLRTALVGACELEKKPIQAKIKLINGIKNLCIDTIPPVEEKFKGANRLVDDRKDREEAEKAKAEIMRVEIITDRICSIERLPIDCMSLNSWEVLEKLSVLQGDTACEWATEHKERAVAIMVEAVKKLTSIAEFKKTTEDHEKKVEADKKEAEEKLAIEKEKEAAWQQKIAAENAAEQKKLILDRLNFEREQREIRVENIRIEKEKQAAIDKIEEQKRLDDAEEAKVAHAKDVAARAKKQSEKDEKHRVAVQNEVIGILQEEYGLHGSVATSIVQDIEEGIFPRLAVVYQL